MTAIDLDAIKARWAERIAGAEGVTVWPDMPPVYLDGIDIRDLIAEVERLREENEPPEKGVRVTVIGDDGDKDTAVIDDTYVVICAGNRYMHSEQRHANGTAIITVKRRDIS